MNIFALDKNPAIAARMHCDKHLVKMIIEYAQLLSTAHRLLDGSIKEYSTTTSAGKPKVINFPVLPGESTELFLDKTFVKPKYKIQVLNRKCYNATHANHPSAIWTRKTSGNYQWLFELLAGCFSDYTRRYGKVHATEKLKSFLSQCPKNIAHEERTPFAVAMPDEYKVPDAVISYQNFYLGSKIRFAKWTNTEVPEWFRNGLSPDADITSFQRTRDVRACSY